MRLIYTYLITIAALFSFTCAAAQTTPVAKKPVVKKHGAKKPPAITKKVVVTAKKTVVRKPTPKPQALSAKTAADVKRVTGIAKTLTDTTRKGGQNPNTDQNKNNVLSEEIIVTTAYKPVLADAVKIRRNPDLEDKEPFKAPLTYTAIDKTLEDNTGIKELPAMKIPKDRDSIPYNSYAKLGVGNLKTTYGELYIDNGKDEALQAGGYFKHLAQNGSLYKQNFQKDEAGVFGKSIGDLNTLSGRIDYDYRSNYFYGYNQDAPPATLHVDKQHFNTLSAEGELTKNYKDDENQFTYAAKLTGYTFSNAFAANENNIVLSGYINETVNQFYTGISGSLDFSTVKDSAYNISNNIVRVNPYLKLQGDNYKLDAGINLVDEFGYNNRFHLFPAVRLEFEVIPKYVRLFAEVKGDVNRSSLREFSEENPFLGANIPIQNSVDKLDISAGLKGMIAPGLGFKATIFRNSVNGLPLFVSNFNFAQGYNRFTVLYDGGGSRVNGLNAELNYKPTDNLDIFGKAEIKSYQLATETEPWNLPSFILTAGTKIRINDQISIHGTLIYRGSTYDRLSLAQLVNISSFADVSAGADYKINKRFSLFLQVNNLLSVNYEKWLYYPDYGFNIFGGVGYKF